MGKEPDQLYMFPPDSDLVISSSMIGANVDPSLEIFNQNEEILD